MRAIQQTVQSGVEAVQMVAVFVAQHAGLQAGHGVQECQRGNLSARQHKIAQTDLNVDIRVDKTLINAFVAPTNQNGTGTGRPLFNAGVVQRLTNGRKQNHGGFVFLQSLRSNGFQA